MEFNTIMNNMAQIDTISTILAVKGEKKTEAQEKVASGFLSLGVKGDKLVVVDYGSNIFTALIAGIKRIFAGISLDTKAVGKVFVETQKNRAAIRADKKAELDATVMGKLYNAAEAARHLAFGVKKL